MKAKASIFCDMVVLLHILFFITFQIQESGVAGQATVNCKYNEYITENILGNLSCVRCPKCAAGMGLVPECGSFIKYGSKFECQPCTDGISYSTSYSIGSCQPCGICTDHQKVITKCNKTHNSKCGKSCQKGFYYSPDTFDCQECSWCCAGSHAVHVKDCEVSGIPFYKQCSVENGIHCQPRCTEKQYVYVDKTLNKTCFNCPSCAIGKGLSPECSTVITNKRELKCITCVPGKTFSDVQDSSSCKNCTKCDIGKKIERICNTTHDTLCGDCMHGFYADKLDNKKICHVCSPCCGDKLDVHVPECKAQGMRPDKQCAYTKRALTRCTVAKNKFLKISLGLGISAAFLVCIAAGLLMLWCRKRNRFSKLVNASSETSMDQPYSTQVNQEVQERPSRGSSTSLIKFLQTGVKIFCQVPEVGQELLEKMTAEVCWNLYNFPELKESQVFLSPVIKLNPEMLPLHQPLKINLPHSAHYDKDNQQWSIAVLKSNHSMGSDSSSQEWTLLNNLQNIDVDRGGVEFSDNVLGTYVVVGTPGEEQKMTKKRMCCAVFGEKEPRVGHPYLINMYLLDDCEPSFSKIRNEEEFQGSRLMASLRLLHTDVHPNSVININIEKISDGWDVEYSPKEFKCEQWVDSYRRNLKVKAVFKHVDLNKQDFRCLFKVMINDTDTVEVPVINYFENYMPEPIFTSIQVCDGNPTDDPIVLDSSFNPSTSIPISTLSNKEISDLCQSLDAGSIGSFARRIIPGISDSEVAFICSSPKPVISMIDMVKNKNSTVTRDDLNDALKQERTNSQGPEDQPLMQNGNVLV